MSIEGGCLCGKVRYQINGKLLGADHCHCSICRRQHGAAFATYADFKPEEFRWVTGADLVKVYEPSSNIGWAFCSECGSSLAGTEDGQPRSITLATTVGELDIQPESHIFVSSKADWYEIRDTLPQHESRAPEG